MDAPDATLLPGLIETHVHLTVHARAAATVEAVIDQLVTDDDWTIAIRAVQAAQACLGVGITTVRDCGARGLVVLRLRDLIAQGFINGGAQIVIHSDAIAPFTTCEDSPCSLVAAVDYGGFSPVEAIRACTGLAARAIGPEGEAGTRAPGMAADLLLVDGDPTADSRDIATTRKRVPGRAVYRDGREVARGGWVRTSASGVRGND